MKKFERVGVGIDFGDHGEKVLVSAASLARQSGAAIDLIHVLRPPPVYDRVLASVQSAPDLDAAASVAAERLDELAARAPLAGLTVRSHVGVGRPDVELVRIVGEAGDDLIVLGPSSRDSSPWLRIGRTAERVLRTASMPVLIAKKPLDATPRRIVAMTDFSDASAHALVEAASLARSWGAELVLIHVLEPIIFLQGWGAKLAGGSDIYAVDPADLEPEWEAILGRLDLDGVTLRHETAKGEVVPTLVARADALEADLVVLGTHGRTGLSHALLGSVAQSVLEETPLPVLVVRSDAESFILDQAGA